MELPDVQMQDVQRTLEFAANKWKYAIPVIVVAAAIRYTNLFEGIAKCIRALRFKR
jgi:hypothetical protein